ncbi:MAG: Levodione reductase [Syntrophorhabdaceae bacterium PtaU1.Bin034]|nr:MAG: Levodione reductase [Syntrophorhabdaceae bacterium PtaU1.Bin034]
MGDLKDRIAVVTGGGRGLGAAICRNLADAGAIVVAAEMGWTYAQQIAQELKARGKIVEPVEMDVSDEVQVERTVNAIKDKHGRVDVLINNAGTDVTLSVEELSIAQWDRVLAVNLRGPFLMAKTVLPLMKQQGSGYIINVASTAAKRAWANASAYHASKWGLLGFTHALHVEARPHNIKVSALVVGGMRTPFLLERFPDIDVTTLQDPANVAETVRFMLCQPIETVMPEVMVLPMRETSWP